MTGDHFRDALASLGLGHAEFARMIGANARTASKWATGETRIPGAVDVLVRLLQAKPALIQTIKGMQPPAPRERAHGD